LIEELGVKALRWTEFSKLFVFASFGIVRFPKFGNFSEISGFFNSQKFCEKSLEINESKTPVFEGFGVKVEKRGSKRGFSEHSEFTENLKFVQFRTF